MKPWNDLLIELVETARERKRLEVIERDLKEQLILAHKLTQPETNLFHVGEARVLVKQKTDLKIHKSDELVAILGKRGAEVLKPNQKLTWALLSKEPSLMAKAIAGGMISVTATTYAEVNLGAEDKTESPATIEDKPVESEVVTRVN